MRFFQFLSVLGPAALVLSSLADAAHIPVIGRSSINPVNAKRKVSRRSTMSGLTNSNDVMYMVKITLGGAPYDVMIDTGSSDLWVATDQVPNSSNSGLSTGVQYAIGGAEGPLLFADLEFAGYTIPQQAFFKVTPDANHTINEGLIGLGPWFVSNIYNTLGGTAGFPPVDNIFRQNRTTPNYLTVLLGRSKDPSNNFPGDFTVGELLPGYEDIQNQPKLPVDFAKYGNQHWSALLDEDGIIGPNGQPISVKTRVTSTKNKHRLTAMFDTGYSLPQVPSAVARAIYSQIENATLQNIPGLGQAWVMPCDKEVNITFKAGGLSYPIHPLDATMSPSDLGLEGEDCIGMFQPIVGSASNQDIDMILGMAFLKNTYLLVNYGNFVPNETTTTEPFIQLLSTSNDTSVLHSEFVQVRLNGTDTTTTQRLLIGSGSGTESKTTDVWTKYKKYIIIGASVSGVAILLLTVLCCLYCCRSRGGSKVVPTPWTSGSAGEYQALDKPAPAAATDIHAAPPYTSYAQPPSIVYHPPHGPWKMYGDH